jgi:hypothetical protein
MISTSATVFAQYAELTVPRISRRLQTRYDAIRLPDGRFVLHMPTVGTVVLSAWDDAIRLQYVAEDAAADFAARTALETILRKSLRGVVFTIAWEEVGSVPIPLR